ncbi:galactose mutarotase-like protein [Auricularia subglabra TFB-10046 SS5]|nr:galactose mutarotase-like protein [Auricularia subglabra TFB-10046 SS5]
MAVLDALRRLFAWFYALVGGKDPQFEETVIESPDGKARAAFIGLGATLAELWVPDANGTLRDVVLGYDDRTLYLKDPAHPVFGAIVGRCAGRISNGAFTLDGKTYTLAQNDGTSTIHGGSVGWDRRTWSRVAATTNSATYELVDRAFEGFPGTVTARATYELLAGPELRTTIRCTTSEKTPIVPTSHIYWNLDAEPEQTTVHDHIVRIAAERRLELGGLYVPTGQQFPVADTVYDFRQPQTIGVKWGELTKDGANGYNDTWVFDPHDESVPVFSMWSTKSRIRLDIKTNQSATVMYTGGYLQDVARKRGGTYGPSSGVAVEQQARPDAVNRPEWGENVVFDKGEEMVWRTSCAFSVQPPEEV